MRGFLIGADLKIGDVVFGADDGVVSVILGVEKTVKLQRLHDKVICYKPVGALVRVKQYSPSTSACVSL